MLHYIDNGDTLTLDGMTIPKEGGNRHYLEALEAVANGEAEIVLPKGKTLSKEMSIKIQEIKDKAESFLSPFASEYGTLEMISWSTQLDEARKFLNDPNSSTPWLDAASVSRGMSKESFANRIVANASAWASLQGNIAGQRLAYTDQVEAISQTGSTDDEKIVLIKGLNITYHV